jgi:hypothetical protein
VTVRLFARIAVLRWKMITNLEQWPLSGLATSVLILITAYGFLYRLQLVKSGENEPPTLPSSAPFVGHLLGMILQGGRYIKTLG